MNSVVVFRFWLGGLLVAITAGVGFLVSRVPSDGWKLGGVFLLTMGAVNILLHRRVGRQVFVHAQSMPAIVARFWQCGGEDGAKFLYLGIGIILFIAGCVLLVGGWVRHSPW
jgi:hypothetical protein